MSSFNRRMLRRGAAAIAGAMMFSAYALAVDPEIDPMRSATGPTAGSPSQASRDFQRGLERGPTLSQRFGLPSVSGPIPPILPPVRQQPVFDSPDNAWPPPVTRTGRPARER